MKKLFLLLLVFPFFLSAQPPANINLHFAGVVSDSCNLKIDNLYIDEYNPNLKAVIKNNQCSFNIILENPGIARLIYNKQSVVLFIHPGDEMDINIGADSLPKAISFSGRGAVENSFLNSFYNEYRNDYDKVRVHQAMLTTAVDPFEMHLFDERKKQKEFFDKQDKTKFSKAFTDYIDQTIRYNYFASLLSFPIVNANQSTTILTVNALPDVMVKTIDSKLVNDDALISESYRDFITHYVIYTTSKGNGFNKFTDYNISMDRKIVTAKSILSGKTLIWYIANFLNSECEKVAPYTAKSVYAQLNDIEKGGSYTKLIKAKAEARIKTKEVTAKDAKTNTGATGNGKKNPFEGVALKDITGKEFNPKDIEGKVVYVDYWASWCGPCRQEFPASKHLHERFTAKQLKNIVFLYISIDGNEGSWKNAVEQIGMNGLLLISPGDWNSDIVKYFQINSIPRYMLIDKTGAISNGNAPRPSSDDNIYNEIVKLLDK